MRLALALLALAATAAVLRRRRPVTAPQCDDSEIVGMPTTWSAGRAQFSDMWGTHTDDRMYMTWNPGMYIELALTSRN